MAVDLKHRRDLGGDDLQGHEWESANKCAKCLGVLSDAKDGHYHTASGGVAICCECGYGGSCPMTGK